LSRRGRAIIGVNELLASARAVHFAAALWVFGELAFACAMIRRAGPGAPGPGDTLRVRLPLVVGTGVVIAIVSAVAWLAAVTATMSGLSWFTGIGPSTLATVLGGTLFGKVWILRLGLALVLLLASRRLNAEHTRRALVCSTAVAAIYLATIAWSGHAAAGEAATRSEQLACDVVHLLAAGAWLGALPALIYALGIPQPISGAAWATRRFSAIAVACVIALVLSGIGNSWFLVGSIPALFGTTYGSLLLAKLALLALMLGIAALNRWVWTPRLAAGDPRALRGLRRNTMLEITVGLLVVLVVGVLGTTIPAAHQSPVWPFAHSLSLVPLQESATTRSLVLALSLAAAGGLPIVVAGMRRHARAWVAAGLAVVGAATIMGTRLLAVPAYPTSYAASPVPYTTMAIVDGAGLYARHCAACHGADGTGSGPAAAGLASRPADLVRHAGTHPPGDLYWWIAHGRTGTSMPPFSATLDNDDIWRVVQFLRALSDAASFSPASGDAIAGAPVAAPDFSYELPGRGQQTLLRRKPARDTLLVLYALPGSLARLRCVAAERTVLGDRGIDVVAIGSDRDETRAASSEVSGGESVVAVAGRDVAAAYAMFAGPGAASPEHAEFLIDRRGRFRARWVGVPGRCMDRDVEIVEAASMADRESPRPTPSHGHAH
jgi:putative copper export protein/mono/diheme cytochrome c family protein